MPAQRLNASQIRSVHRLLGEARDLRWGDPAVQSRRLADGLAALLGAEYAFHGSFDDYLPGKTPLYRQVVLGSSVEPALLSYFQRMGNELSPADDPMVVAGARLRGDASVITYRSIEPRLDARRFGPFTDIAREYRLRDNLSTWYRHPRPRSRISGFAVHRLGNGKIFSEREQKLARYFSSEYRQMSLEGLLSPPPVIEQLAPRQRQVLDALLRGRVPKQIAVDLNLSVFTVREHISAIYGRLGIDHVGGLLALVTQPTPPLRNER